MLDVCLLGTGGMMPLPNRFLTSLLLRFNGKMMLIDCGEGTQVTLKMSGFGFKNIDTIAFTHTHGDHITGLCGMLLTIGNSGRTAPLNIIGVKGIEKIVKSLLIVAKEIPFELNFIEVDIDNINNEKNNNEIIIGDFVISVLKADHAIECLAYKVEVKRAGKFSVEKAMKNSVPKNLWGTLQKKHTITENGIEYLPSMVLEDDRKSLIVSYMTDTRPVKDAPDFVKNSDLFICEGIYGEDDKIEKAIQHKHMTFSEAATIAKEGDVKELWLTHYSPALQEPEEFLEFATNIFPNTHAGFDRKTKALLWQ